jgi:hypothetical protein
MDTFIANYLNSLEVFYQGYVNVQSIQEPATIESYEKNLSVLFKDFKVWLFPISGEFPVIERITVNKRVTNNQNTRIYDARKLSYPPSEYVTKYGRANLKNQSVFYGAFYFMTAVQEINPEVGDIITISQWKNKTNKDLIVCPMVMQNNFDEIYNLLLRETQNIDNADFILAVQSFYAKHFSLKIDSNNNKGYLFTALLANKILNEYENGIIDAILYPSVQDNLRTNNIAIKQSSFDENYSLFHTIEQRVLSIQKNKEYLFERLGESREIRNNYIEWK